MPVKGSYCRELTPADLRIIRALSAGRSQREIAAEVNTSLHAVAMTMVRVRHKLGAETTAQVMYQIGKTGLC